MITVPRNSSEGTSYHGRFAPTPSGPLHFGSVVTALGSYLQARSHGGYWSLRFEDLDAARIQNGAADSILRDLERLGLAWDGEPGYQSRHHAHYEAALEHLSHQGLIFACGCSRREVRGIYPGSCRDGLPAGRKPRSLRLRIPGETVTFKDRLQGRQVIDLQNEVGDFIVRRADNITAYHLAVVVDDAEAGITEVVRGADLLDATAPQIVLQRLLNKTTPDYLHLPLALDPSGRKISKQDHAPPISGQPPADVLLEALHFLGQNPDPELRQAPVIEILDWAQIHWRLRQIPCHNRPGYKVSAAGPSVRIASHG